MKRLSIAAMGGLVVVTLLAVALDEAFARAGGSRSSGSRGSRSFSSPARPAGPMRSAPAPGSSQFRQQAPPPQAPLAQPAPAGGGFWRSLAGGIAGGFLGAMLFRGLAGAGGFGGGGFGGGGIGLFEILLLAGVAYFIYWIIKRGRQAQAAPAGAYYREAAPTYAEPAYAPAAAPALAEPSGEDLARGLGYIRQMDASFDEPRFKDAAMDHFFKVQGAWMSRDLAPVRPLLTDEIAAEFQKDLDEQKRQGQINRLENIAVRAVDVTEAWQERGQDYLTVRFHANLLDYTLDERTGQVVSGSKSDPVKFEEYWTFTRPVGPNPWKLSAINQAE